MSRWSIYSASRERGLRRPSASRPISVQAYTSASTSAFSRTGDMVSARPRLVKSARRPTGRMPAGPISRWSRNGRKPGKLQIGPYSVEYAHQQLLASDDRTDGARCPHNPTNARSVESSSSNPELVRDVRQIVIVIPLRHLRPWRSIESMSRISIPGPDCGELVFRGYRKSARVPVVAVHDAADERLLHGGRLVSSVCGTWSASGPPPARCVKFGHGQRLPEISIPQQRSLVITLTPEISGR